MLVESISKYTSATCTVFNDDFEQVFSHREGLEAAKKDLCVKYEAYIIDMFKEVYINI